MSVLICLTTLLMLFTKSAFAWWGGGHLTVARIAYNLLEEREPEILADANEILSALSMFITDEKDYSFVECATFADVVKDAGLVDQSHWHFADTPIFDEGFTKPDWHDDKYNVTWAIQEMVDSLVLKEKPVPEHPTFQDSGVSLSLAKSMNLRLLIHYVGDVHQPLHSSSRFTAKRPKGDEGGNLFFLESFLGINELHAVWDSVVYSQHDLDEKLLQPFNLSQWELLGDVAADIQTRFPEDFFGDELLNKPSNQWVTESFQIAKDIVYDGVEEHTIPSEEYRTRGLVVAEQQLAKAGYRLFRLLKSIHLQREQDTQEETSLFLQ